ncbi:transmembrane protein 251 [Biomphalaria glabrata]|uniref:Lysosomal enzyme trafficking factor n=1 Tax=Biomphalaria glabrata TaxID=6526 RepID=A0A2C9K0D0_BIOGL|nr:transmembrane protein 251-like [Biomphalaria glabrata]KAI8788762.1 transmembrane protein 251 [Biomphalaria glabrata]
MKFRQRMAWILLTLFLTASFAFAYYLFEINDHFNTMAVEHVQIEHGGDIKAGTFLEHATHLPLAVWLLIFLLPYLQVFGLLLACTRPEPRLSLAYIWPGTLFFKSRKLLRRYHPHDSKSINSSVVFNGHVAVFDA